MCSLLPSLQFPPSSVISLELQEWFRVEGLAESKMVSLPEHQAWTLNKLREVRGEGRKEERGWGERAILRKKTKRGTHISERL